MINMPKRLLLLFGVLLANFAFAQEPPPSFETMVHQSTMVAVVEVTKGGPWVASAKVLIPLKGKKPEGEIRFGGFNSRDWSKEKQTEATLKPGDRRLIFLQWENIFSGLTVSREDVAALKAGEITREELQARAKPKEETMLAMAQPGLGCYPVLGTKLQASWLDVPQRPDLPALPLQIALPLLKGVVVTETGRQPEKARNVIREHLTLKNVQAAESPEQMLQLEWLLCAQALFAVIERADAVITAGKHSAPQVRIAVARALRALPENHDSLTTVEAMFKTDDSRLQAEAAGSLMSGKYSVEQVERILKGSLAVSSIANGTVKGLDTIIVGHAPSGREALVRALTHFEIHKSVHNLLVEFVNLSDLDHGLTTALRDHFLAHPSNIARGRFVDTFERCPPAGIPLFTDYFYKEESDASLSAIQRKILDSEVPVELRISMLQEFSQRVDHDHRIYSAMLSTLSYQELPPDLYALNTALLITEGQADSLKRIKAFLNDRHGNQTHIVDCMALFVLSGNYRDDKVAEIAIEAMKLFPENNAIFAAAAAVGGKSMRFRVHQQVEHVTRLAEDEKGLLGLAAIKQVVEDRLSPPTDLRERVRNFVDAVRDGHESGLPHVEALLLVGGMPLLKGEERSYLIGELRELVAGAKANDQLVAAFAKVSGESMLPDEDASLRALADETNKADGLLPVLNFLEVLQDRK
jgi:hypothetical protein